MHLLVHMEARLIAPMAPVLPGLPVQVVIDHVGRIDASERRDEQAFQALLGLLDHRNVWCKVSGSERSSQQVPPYDDAWPLARDITDWFTDRVVWGTDWPHPNYRTDPPDDGDLLDLLADIAPAPAALQALMVDNPRRLYRPEDN